MFNGDIDGMSLYQSAVVVSPTAPWAKLDGDEQPTACVAPNEVKVVWKDTSFIKAGLVASEAGFFIRAAGGIVGMHKNVKTKPYGSY